MKKLTGILLLCILAGALTACSQSSYSGSRLGNNNQLVMEYRIFNTTDFQLLELEKGDKIQAEIVNDSGSVSVVIQQEGGDVVYQKKDILTKSFQVEAKESGTYKVLVTGNKAKGKLSFVKNSGEQGVSPYGSSRTNE